MMKSLFICIIVFFLYSCSSNPKNNFEKDLEELLIEKPKINYKLNSLPRDINVIYFSDQEDKNSFPEEIKGLLVNYYSFSERKDFFLKMNLIDLSTLQSCPSVNNRNSYNLIFLIEESINKLSLSPCITNYIKNNSLLISNYDNKFATKNFRKFIVNRNDDKYELIKYMNSISNTIMVVDNRATNDKFSIGELWKNEYKKAVAEYKTLNSSESSQEIFSKLLLANQSIKRKRKLSRIISTDFEHQSRTRMDIDTLFLSVNIQEARSLKPALDYIFYDDMEVFLINDWKGDISFLENDKDLQGVISIDIPFMLPSNLPEDLKSLETKSRNFAIGYDAFEIFLLINGARNLNRTSYKGLTGEITFSDKEIKRKSKIFKINDSNFYYLN